MQLRKAPFQAVDSLEQSAEASRQREVYDVGKNGNKCTMRLLRVKEICRWNLKMTPRIPISSGCDKSQV
jgi:hypothetical protein